MTSGDLDIVASLAAGTYRQGREGTVNMYVGTHQRWISDHCSGFGK